METRANHILVGGFVLVVLVLLLASLLWLGKFGDERNVAVFDIVFSESVIGLTKGSPVSYNGVPVGEVEHLQVNRKNLSQVLVRVRINGRELVRSDTEVTLGFSPVTGVADVRLSGGSLSLPALYKNGEVPRLIAQASPLAELTESGRSIMVSVNQIAARLDDLLSEENLQHVTATLVHLEGLTGTLNDERAHLAEVIEQSARVTRRVEQVLENSSRLMDSAQALVENEGRRFLEQSGTVVGQLGDLGAQLDGLIRDNRAAITRFSNQELRQAGPVLDELHGALNALRRLSEQLSQSDSVFLGQPQPKEFKSE